MPASPDANGDSYRSNRSNAVGAAATKVVVIGGGTAGLAAARTMIDNWPSDSQLDLMVLEAHASRVGGRVWTVDAEGAGTAFASLVGAATGIRDVDGAGVAVGVPVGRMLSVLGCDSMKSMIGAF